MNMQGIQMMPWLCHRGDLPDRRNLRNKIDLFYLSDKGFGRGSKRISPVSSDRIRLIVRTGSV